MNTVENTLLERGERYGDFTDHAAIAQCLQDGMRLTRPNGWERLSDVQRQALTVIADKIARILSGDPNYADNWHDIQGYAKLVEDRLPAAVAVRNPAPTRPAWPDDKAYRWMAQTSDGEWYTTVEKPRLDGIGWLGGAKCLFLRLDQPNPNWRDTLIERGADE